MKKNKMMRLASSLLVAVLLTSSVISGTFAKYVTEGKAFDQAQVAKWGVKITATDDTAFSPYYVEGGLTEHTSKDGASVVADGSYNLVAPGTAGEFAGFKIEGQPEVDVHVKYVATVDLAGWTINASEFYCPLVFTVKHGSTVEEVKMTAEIDTEAELEAALKKAIEGAGNSKGSVALGDGVYYYEANTDLASKEDVSISWVWAFGTSDAADDATNMKDTALGNLAADATAPTVSVNVVATVTQVN